MKTQEISKVLRMIESAEASLKAARSLLAEIAPGVAAEAGISNLDTSDTKAYESGETQIVEGIFDGQAMIGPNEKTYPVPANYASKSKLIEGDRLKLTILSNGTFLYKQIAPAPRHFLKGTLINEDGHYKVVAEGKTYKVILASVTYYKGNQGDEVTLIVPKNSNSEWGAIEAIIPQIQGDFDEDSAY